MAFKPPQSFTFSEPTSWPAWKDRFSRFRLASKLHKEDQEIQVSSLLYAMGSDADKIFTQFGLSADDGKDYKKVLEKFDEHFIPQRNVIHVRATFHKRNQKEGETIEQYVRVLYELAEHADFDKKDETIRDRLVVGMRDKEMSQKLQLEGALTLQDAVKKARQHEQVKGELAQQSEETDHSVDRLQQKSSKSHRHFEKRTHKQGTASGETGKECGRCGRNHMKDKCPAWGKKCLKCGKNGHFAKMCKTKKPVNKTNNEVSVREEKEEGKEEIVEDEKEEVRHFFLDAADSENSTKAWRVEIEVKGVKIDWKIDTGADVNIIGKSTWKKIGEPKLSPCTRVTLHSPGGEVKMLGCFQTSIRKLPTTIYVVQSQVDNLLSREMSVQLNLVQRVDAATSTFSEVKCKPIKIKLREGAVPYSVTTARRVPIPLHEKVKKELQRMKDCGVIEEITEPTDWVSPMVPVLKPNGEVRICVDLKKLNQAVQRERYVIPTIDDIIHELRGSSVFSKLDAQAGFWQLPLDPETSKLTTFITPFGRFYMKRLPFGISSAPEIFQRTMTEILDGISGVICYFDDILLHTKTESEHDTLLQTVKERLREVHLVLNEEKCEYKKEEITFLGHIINSRGVKPDPSKVEAIVNLREPENVAELRRYLGMVQYLSRYLPHLSTTLRPLNDLLSKDAAWTWGPEQRRAFDSVKAMLTTAPTLAYYDPSKPTVVEADSSSYGLGGVLLQEQDGELRPVAYCSRTLTQAEQRYAQIEKECLATVYACERFDRYLVGLDTFHVYTDHKPLVPLMNTKDLSDTPLRCQRMLMRLMRYHPVAVYQPGKSMWTSDTLSRSPLIYSETPKTQVDIECHIDMVKSSWPASDRMLNEIRTESQKDINVKTAMEYTLSGWPQYRQDCQLAARDMFAIRGELSVADGILLKGDRLVIPYNSREYVLNKIHDGHLGIVKCRERANQGVWWPGISKDIQNIVARCRHCIQKQPNQSKEPLVVTKLPERPFQRVATDLCEKDGKQYLVYIDYYSRWIDIHQIQGHVTAAAVISKLKASFAASGIPETLMSDNGPQFQNAEFRKFSKEWNFEHVTSSPQFPQSNGEAERAVRTAKDILSQSDQQLALLIYRATPLPSLGVSPADLAMGRRLRTTLPVLPSTLLPRTVNPKTVQSRDTDYKLKAKAYFDRDAHHLPELCPGDPVLMKGNEDKAWQRPGVVVKQCAPRSYVVKTADGERRRNRRHLRRDTTASQHDDARTSLEKPDDPVQHPTATTSTETTTEASEPPPSTAPIPQPSGRPPDSTYTTRSGRQVIQPARFRDDS